VPSYTEAYGPANFLLLCNLSVFITALGLWLGSSLLLSSQAVGLLVVSLVWNLDVLSRLLTGAHWIGGTEYMWDPRWPLATRLMSLYHVVAPLLIVYALGRVGYDRRGLPLQSAIAIVAILLGRLFGPAANLNHAFSDPILKRSFEPAALHLAIVIGVLVGALYPLTDAVLRRSLPARVS
jgi:hypothetical protein